MFKKLRTVIYTAKNLPAAREWYIKATGQQPYFDQSFYVGFDINGFELGLDPNDLFFFTRCLQYSATDTNYFAKLSIDTSTGI